VLGVLESTRRVVERAETVQVDQGSVERHAARLAERPLAPQPWRTWPHWWSDSEQAANFVLVLDALNFSFWGEPRWRVEYDGQRLDGYWALAASLRRAIERGVPILDASYLVSMDEAAVRNLFAGEGEIPLIQARLAHLHEVGRGLRDAGGSFAKIVARAGGKGERLVAQVIHRFPSFDDVATYEGAEVRFYKRAQILVSDLYGMYQGSGLGDFSDLDRLTAFADYKIPQVLREAGILVYVPDLAATVDSRQEIPPGDPREVEIRAATVWACERLRQALAERQPGMSPRAFEIDWLLWSDAQGREIECPYHRTRTIFY
jgi:hypothetical protein